MFADPKYINKHGDVELVASILSKELFFNFDELIKNFQIKKCLFSIIEKNQLLINHLEIFNLMMVYQLKYDTNNGKL